MKKIIFFDADGTLWYPIKTKYSKHPIWVYKKHKDIKKARKEFILAPTVLSTLKKLKALGIKLIILSTSPYVPKKANILIRGSAKHFDIEKFFDEVHGTRDYHESKGEYILDILKKYRIQKKDALMVGDSYNWDYKPAQRRGIDAVLIEHSYEKTHLNYKRVKRKIKKLKEVLKYIKQKPL